MTNDVGYIRTFKDRKFYFEHPEDYEFDIEEIAHSLSNQCRWTGHCRKFYSIAEHSIHCARMSPVGFTKEAFLHDASEAYVVDLSRPLKQLVSDYKTIQKNIEAAVAKFYEFPYPMSLEVQDIDNRMLVTEWQQLFNETDISLGPYNNEPYSFILNCWLPEKAEKEFLWWASAIKV